MKELYVVQISLLSVMVNFAEGELALPVRKILWAPTNRAHHNHLHVEGPHVHGTLANCTSKWTEAITEIRGALDGRFGEGDHYQVWDEDLGWTHMGVYNCRNIAGTSTPSQHSFSNAIDIGPYYGKTGQQKFYDFLTRKAGEEEGEDDMPLTEAEMDQIAEKAARAVWTYMIRDFPSDSRLHTNTVLRAIRNDVYSIERIVKNLDANDGATAEEIADEIAARLVD